MLVFFLWLLTIYKFHILKKIKSDGYLIASTFGLFILDISSYMDFHTLKSHLKLVFPLLMQKKNEIEIEAFVHPLVSPSIVEKIKPHF